MNFCTLCPMNKAVHVSESCRVLAIVAIDTAAFQGHRHNTPDSTGAASPGVRANRAREIGRSPQPVHEQGAITTACCVPGCSTPQSPNRQASKRRRLKTQNKPSPSGQRATDDGVHGPRTELSTQQSQTRPQSTHREPGLLLRYGIRVTEMDATTAPAKLAIAPAT